MRLIFFCLFFFVSCLFAGQDEISAEQNVIVLASSEVHNGNYFAMGRSVEISGTVNGDVYAMGEQVVIDGIVNGDVLSCGGSIDISGKVSRNCRLLGGQVLISGDVCNNVTAVAGNMQLLPSASIGGNLVAVAGNIDLASSIGTDVTVIASSMRLSSHIKQNLQGYVGNMRITSKAVIGGDVDYRSSTEAWIEPGASILGHVVHHPTFVHGLVKGTWIQKFLVGSKILVILMNFLYTFVLGLIIYKMFPRNLDSALQVLNKYPLKAFVYGLMLLIFLPLASLVLLMTILGVPFALALIALNIIGFYTAKVYTIFWASNWALGKVGFKQNRLVRYFCGTVLYFGLTAIPIFGTIVAFTAMLFGLGAGILAQARHGLFNPSSPEK